MPNRKPWQPKRKDPKYQNVIRKRRARWLNKYKVARGCDLCGYNKHPVALDWDHLVREDKEFMPSARFLLCSLKRIFKEIRKCRLLCSNCHRIETYENQHFNNRNSLDQ